MGRRPAGRLAAYRQACSGGPCLSYITRDGPILGPSPSMTRERAAMPTMPSGLRQGLTSYADPGFSLFLRKAFIKAKGFSDDALDRPIIGITDTYSDFNPCHGNVPQLIEAVKRGVMLAGGLPMEFPTIS